jgi:hypothetical protein
VTYFTLAAGNAGAAAPIAERFSGRMRYGGSSLGDPLASAHRRRRSQAGCSAPIRRRAIAIYIAICGAIAPAATVTMPDHTGGNFRGGSIAMIPFYTRGWSAMIAILIILQRDQTFSKRRWRWVEQSFHCWRSRRLPAA